MSLHAEGGLSLKICIDERIYESNAAEIMDQLRLETFGVGVTPPHDTETGGV